MLKRLIATSVLMLSPLAARPQAGTVTIPVAVADSKGAPVADLGKKDFTILVSGSASPIRNFSAAGLAPRDAHSKGQAFLYRIAIDQAAATPLKTFHPLEVRIDRPNLKVHTVKGYYTGPGQK